MKKNIKHVTGPNQESEILKREINNNQPGHEPIRVTIYDYTETDLNAKILKITEMIKEQFPDLVKYLEEMPVTIPNKKNPKVTLDELKKYYESLYAMLNKYKLEHQKKQTKKQTTK